MEYGYEKPGPQVTDRARYFPLIKKKGQVDVSDVSFEERHASETEFLMPQNISGTEKASTNQSGQQSL